MPVSVLICDDAPEMRFLVRCRLEGEPDIEVVDEAADGPGGLERAIALDPDVVLLDLVMPGMDGREVIAGMREAAPRTAIVVLSGFDDGVGPECLELGAHAHLSKGEPMERVAETVRRVAAGKAAP